MEKLLTVSIAAYNIEKYLNQCLTPFADNKFSDDLEILIIDDGSSDGTLSLAQKYVERYPAIFRIISKDNGGWGSTVNTGIEHASGKYFKQLDGDDYYDKGNLDAFLNYLGTIDTDVVLTPFVLIDDATGVRLKTKTLMPDLEIGKPYAVDSIIASFQPEMHAMTFRTELLKLGNVHITEHCFYTDMELVIKALSISSTISYFDHIIYCYRVARDGQSMSLTGLIKHYKEHLKILYLCLNYAEENLTGNLKATYDKRLMWMMRLQYNLFFQLKPNCHTRREFKSFDANMQKYKSVYFENRWCMRLCRNTGFFLYPLAVKITKLKYRGKPLLY